ncbi:MAG: NTP transferase domain-containing protein, partial [Dehalococcoidia bacterium]|nr:NTP transferase domain-containing protein [Dehalococcoidia bacterium]
MKAVLICGGIGKRMVPITKDKTLLKFNGEPLILHQITAATEAGLDQFVIVASPDNLADLKSAVAGVRAINVDFAVQQRPLGMADALLSASALLGDEPFILVNSNDIFDTSAYVQLINEYQRNSSYSGYLTARQVQDYFPGGYLVVNDDSEISHIVEKPPKGEEPSQLINIVIHLHNEPQRLLDYLAKTSSTADDVYEKALGRMIDDGCNMKAVVYGGAWQAVKYPWHILHAMDYFLGRLTHRISPTAQISEMA